MTKRKHIPILSPNVETRPVVGYEGLYEVTADGRVWSVAKPHQHGGQWLAATVGKRGYPKVELLKGGVQKTYTVHRLVAEAWLPNPDGLGDVNHISGIKTDCRAENLEWCTRAQNCQHAYDAGLRRAGSLSDEEVATIRQLASAGTKQRDLAARFGVSAALICEIVSHKIYRQTTRAAELEAEER
jgi:hypothetical protein